MVNRWNFKGMRTEDSGDWVAYEDYLSLQAALRELLDSWDETHYPEKNTRIAELRKQFLDI